MSSVYEETCVLHCTDNDNEITVDVIQFNPGHYLTVSVNKQIRLEMRYNDKHGNYVGSMSRLEFTTPGPREFDVTRKTRHF